MLCSDEIFWGKIVSGNLPPRHLTTFKHFRIISCFQKHPEQVFSSASHIETHEHIYIYKITLGSKILLNKAPLKVWALVSTPNNFPYF